jgi:transcriptional regulator with XRE-family HTH domain
MNETLLREHLELARLRRALPNPSDRRLLRRRLGLSQQQLADVLGVDRVTVSRYESGERSPADRLLRDYLRVLGVLEGAQQ